MVDQLPENFSHYFNGVIWNTIAWPEENCLIVEVRNLAEKKVTFSALNYRENRFLWQERSLEEPWWVNATAFTEGVVLFTIYLDQHNPDKKGVLAYAYNDLQLLWWNNDFSVGSITDQGVKGTSGKFGLKEVVLDIATGKEIKTASELQVRGIAQLKKPVQYLEGTDYFDSVRTFLVKKLNLEAISALEYLETSEHIIISCYVRKDNQNELLNILAVFSREGQIRLTTSFGEKVQGIGLDTFFVLNEMLFFVRNKSELVSYKLL